MWICLLNYIVFFGCKFYIVCSYHARTLIHLIMVGVLRIMKSCYKKFPDTLFPEIKGLGVCYVEDINFIKKEHQHPTFEITLLDKCLKKTKNYTYYDGDVYIYKPLEVHCACENLSEDLMMYWIQIDLSEENIDSFCGIDSDIVRNVMAEFLLIDNIKNIKASDNLKKAFRNLFEEYKKEEPNKLLAASYMVAIIQNIVESAKNQSSIMPECIAKCIEYVDKHINTNILVSDFSRITGLSSVVILKKFRRRMGITPSEYISRRKIEKSTELLRAGMTPMDVSEMLCFSSIQYFSKVYKRYTGICPSTERRHCKSKSY